MKHLYHKYMALIVAIGVFAIPAPKAEAGPIWDWIQAIVQSGGNGGDGNSNNQSNGGWNQNSALLGWVRSHFGGGDPSSNPISNTDTSAQKIAETIANDAQADVEDYEEYARRLAGTLSTMSNDQISRVFGY